MFGKSKDYTPEEYGVANLIGMYLIGSVYKIYGDPSPIKGMDQLQNKKVKKNGK